MTEQKVILTLAVDVGQALLENGAEIYRVEETIRRIIEAYDYTDYNVFIFSNGIFADCGEASDETDTIIRQVKTGPLHLKKIKELNQLSRDICSFNVSVPQAREELNRCHDIGPYSDKIQALACGMGCAGFIYIIGASPIDCIFGFLIGAFLRDFTLLATRHNISGVLLNVGGSFLITLFSIFVVAFVYPVNLDMLIIGGIFALIPGTTFTTGIRDLFNADYLSGWFHLIDALMGAAELAIGVGIAFYFFGSVL